MDGQKKLSVRLLRKPMDYIRTNYHTHTTRCNHAVGEDRDYVEAAIAAGIKTLGFSDHIPWGTSFPYEYARTVRMPMSQAEEYVSSIRALQKEYEKDIRILCGFEAEYLPGFWEEQTAMEERLGIDYLILGQHNLEEFQYAYMGASIEDPAVLTAYVDTVIKAVRTGRFLYVAHPDLIRFTGDEGLYQKEIHRLCREMKACGTPLEISLLGTGTGRHYPSDRFFAIAGEEENDVVIGIDAHNPAQIANDRAYEKGMAMIEKYGLHQVQELL